ncbi:MAG: aryl-sulfate sulfotransferase [Christensenella sp.]|nr:aryl-sulfate sulfotransferase [Christensenella sp.]
MKRKLGIWPLLRGVIALVMLAAILVAALWPRLSGEMDTQQSPSSSPTETEPSFGDTLRMLLAEFSAQDTTDALILQELRSGAYSAEEPLILDNPYGCSPLTALAVFTTETPASVHIHVAGKTSDADVDHDLASLETDHLVPIYGLYPDYLNTVTLTVTDASGQKKTSTVQIQTEPIAPETIGNIIIQTDIENAAAISDGMNFLYSQKLAFDSHGDIRWTNNTWVTPHCTLYNYESGTYITPYGAYLEGDVLFIERNFLGKFLRVWYSPYGAHHDIEEGEDGNLLITGSRGAAVEDLVYELDSRTGEVVNTLDLKTVLPRSSERINAAQSAQNTLGFRQDISAADWFHLNAIEWDNGSVILSSRHSSAVVKMTWPSGEIEWILASPYGWPNMFKADLLTPMEGQSEFEWPYWQHAPYLMPDQDNDPDTEDILLFDNGTVRFGEADVQDALRTNNLSAIQDYSRLVQYRINASKGTIEQIWQYGKERGVELYANRCGNAELLANGNRLGFFYVESKDLQSRSAHVVMSEVDAGGNLVWEALLTAENGVLDAYRGNRLPLYRDSDQNLHLGESARVLIPDTVLAANDVELP